MGMSQSPLAQTFEGNCNLINNDTLMALNKVLKDQAKRKRRVVMKKRIVRSSFKKSQRRVLMKRFQARFRSKRKENIGIEKRVRTLKTLVPHRESIGLDGLFRETADYIMSLQMRVQFMQNMVEVLTGSDE